VTVVTFVTGIFHRSVTLLTSALFARDYESVPVSLSMRADHYLGLSSGSVMSSVRVSQAHSIGKGDRRSVVHSLISLLC